MEGTIEKKKERINILSEFFLDHDSPVSLTLPTPLLSTMGEAGEEEAGG